MAYLSLFPIDTLTSYWGYSTLLFWCTVTKARAAAEVIMLIIKAESIMLQNLLIMLFGISLFSAYYAHFYAF